jgi:hypothetical protein
MIFVLLGWLYISLWLLVYGSATRKLLFSLFRVPPRTELPFPSYLTMPVLGFSALAGISSLMSLWIPIDVEAHLILLVLGIGLAYWSRAEILHELRAIGALLRSVPAYVWLLALPMLVFILFYASDAPVYNLDSSRYHIPNIHWTEQYRPILGLVLIQDHVAFESNWWMLHALFDVGPYEHGSFHLFNSGILAFFVLAGTIALGRIIRLGINAPRVIWVVAATITFNFRNYTSFWDLTSASPDPSVLMLWIVSLQMLVYLFTYPPANKQLLWVICAFFVVLSSFGLTAKLSAIMLGSSAILVFALAILQTRKEIPRKQIFIKSGILLSLVFVLVSGHITRKVITSGYPLYPLSSFGFLSGNWKIPKAEADMNRAALNEGQKFPDLNKYFSRRDMKYTFGDWFPSWLKASLTTSNLLWGVLGSGFLLLALAFPVGRRFWGRYGLVLVPLFVGLLFWFTNAPNPRFASGLLIFLFAFGVTCWVTMFLEKFGRLLKPILALTLLGCWLLYILKVSPISLTKNHVKYPFVLVQHLHQTNALYHLKPAPEIAYDVDTTSIPGMRLNIVRWDTSYQKLAYAPSLTFIGDRGTLDFSRGDTIAYHSRRNYYMIYPCYFTPLPSGQPLVRKGIRMRGNRLEDGFKVE